ncbi:MAG: efflux RND transporter periplasmic adaptor subunit [Gammaproteobacteria bacterium]|nr:MAG: efflux RND transporter periplasmic adaptor subunit [Gammaproteobacteria bacterium]RTZ78643.1 MAG: efflux RND transporter periplasmic adaptor subunit [Gammaproteobacteria bacterium]
MKRILQVMVLGLLALQLPVAGAGECRQSPGCVEQGILVSGEVAEVLVKQGSAVRKGQLLLKLDETLFKARVSAAEARLQADEAQLRQAERELERARELYDRTLLSDYELQEAEVAQLEAKAERTEAWSRLVVARQDLRRARLQAPFAGRVDRVFAYPGQAVQNSQRVQQLLELLKEEGNTERGKP